jgi:hypothetical protein
MDTFEAMWERVAISRNGESVSPELRPLVKHAYDQIVTQAPDLMAIKKSLEDLLSFLTTASGRTSVNCFATDLFFALADWNVDWETLPESLTDIIGGISGALHDTVEYPDVAKNFYGLPEDLLERIQNWKPD